ncbi:MAG TPA: MucR family transcriptional regulator [Pedomonas sp.]|uniref:MucR family transcriptional regulator n=1 Tax=Pedomonas sp. TaxID=2976421 RepID=UPI002F3FA4B1
MTTDLLEMTVRLASAHLSINPVSADKVPDFLHSIHKTLKQIQSEEAADSDPSELVAKEAALALAPVTPASGLVITPTDASPQPSEIVRVSKAQSESISSSVAPAPENDLLSLVGTETSASTPRPTDAHHDDPAGTSGEAAAVENPAYAGLDPWLAERITPEVAKKLNRNGSIHPSLHYDHFICLEDGRSVKLLKPHLERRFNMTLEAYIQKWNLPADFPSVTPAYRQKKGLPPLSDGAEPVMAPSVEIAPVIMTDISNPAYKNLDTWLAQRITPAVAKKLNPESAAHPSVFPDHLICLEDGGKVTLLKPYIRSRFNLSLEDYIKRWNLPADYPSAPPRYIERKRRLAQKSGLGYAKSAKAEQAAEPAPAPVKRAKSTRRVVTAARANRASKDVIVEKVVRRQARKPGTLSLFGKKE